jgi:hypothetical protein
MIENKKGIHFDPKKHIYTNSKEERYISGTKFISLFKPKFESEFWLTAKCYEDHFTGIPINEKEINKLNRWRKKAGWRNISKDKLEEFDLWKFIKAMKMNEVPNQKIYNYCSLKARELNVIIDIEEVKKELQQQWLDKTNDSLRKGTKFHDGEEEKTRKKYNFTHDWNWLDLSYPNLEPGKYPELRLYNHEHKIAGSADVTRIYKNGVIKIEDFKGLDIKTPILTDSGWKTMGTLSLQDKVFDKNGKLSKIKHISHVHYNPCYKITFDTNEKIICDHEHKWEICKTIQKGTPKLGTNYYKDVFEIHDTKSLQNIFLKQKKKLKIKISKPLKLKSKDLPIDPYVFGVWLGDGHKADGKITQANKRVWEEIEKRGYELGNDVSQGGAGKAQTRNVKGLHNKLKKINVVKNKHIPEIYFLASYEQRLDLLRGFMDADGYYHKKRKRYVMITSQKWQANDLLTLVSSLGIKATYFKQKTTCKECKQDNYDCFHVCFSSELDLFLSRSVKSEAVQSETDRRYYRYIKNIEKVSTIPTICISIESDTHVYLAGKTLIPTHNTNKQLDFDSFTNPYTKKKDNMLYVCSNMANCSFNHYTLQLSLYGWMLEQMGYKVNKLIIKHIIFDENDRPIKRVPYYCEYMKSTIENMIDYYEKHLKHTL